MKRKQAIAAVILIALLGGVLPGTALALLDESNFKVNNGQDVYEINGTAQIPLHVPAGAVLENILVGSPGTGTPVLLSITYNTDDVTGEVVVPNSGNVIITGSVNPNAAVTTHPVSIEIYVAGQPDPIKKSFNIMKTTAVPKTDTPPVDNEPSTPTTPEGQPTLLALAPTDVNGHSVPSPSGNYGDRILIRVPILNRGDMTGKASRILVTPTISATLDNFPFDIEAVDYTRRLSDMTPGQIQEVQYDMRISKEATAGVKEVKFNAIYFNSTKQAYETATFSVFVTVVKGKTPPITGTEGETVTTAPKIIIEGNTIVPGNTEDGNILYAGEPFSITMKFRNTAKEAVQNIQITLSNEGGSILPANGGSDTLYINRIEAGEAIERTVEMQSLPEAEAKSHSLSIKFGYESAKTLKPYEASSAVSLPIKQRIRMRIDDPVMEPQVMQGESLPVYFNIYNMGNSTVKNLMVSVEGDGLSMEEAYYGGNMGSGQSSTADFAIKAENAGEIEGKVIISYEDTMGEQIKVEKPFTLTVMEMGGGMGEGMIDPNTGMPIDPGMGMPIDPKTGMPIDTGMMPAEDAMGRGVFSKLPQWAMIAIGVVGVGIVAGGILLLRKRRRKRILEDV